MWQLLCTGGVSSPPSKTGYKRSQGKVLHLIKILKNGKTLSASHYSFTALVAVANRPPEYLLHILCSQPVVSIKCWFTVNLYSCRMRLKEVLKLVDRSSSSCKLFYSWNVSIWAKKNLLSRSFPWHRRFIESQLEAKQIGE